MASQPVYDVIVVGSGLTGMGAGRELKLNGLRAVVLEARAILVGRGVDLCLNARRAHALLASVGRKSLPPA